MEREIEKGDPEEDGRVGLDELGGLGWLRKRVRYGVREKAEHRD